MKNIIWLQLMLLLSTTGVAQNYLTNKYQYIPAFSDDFSGSGLNNAIWRATEWNGLPWYQERVYYISSCVTTGQTSASDPANTSGFLRITPFVTTPDDTGFNNTYYSGCITTHSYFRYGYYESRVKMPQQNSGSGSNIGSSWWAWGGGNSTLGFDKLYNEFDVFETDFPNNPLGGILHSTVPRNYGTHYTSEQWPGYTGSQYTADLTNSFHVFGVEWLPEVINFYIDGNLYRSITKLGWTKGTNPVEVPYKIYGDATPVNVVSTPMNWVFWCKRGNNNIELKPDGSKYLEVDYFRYYKTKPTISGATQCGSNTVNLVASSVEPTDIYTWSLSGGGASLSSSTGNIVTCSLPAGNMSTTVTATASGLYPIASASNTFVVTKTTGNICGFTGVGYTPTIYIATNFAVPQAFCNSTVVDPGMKISLLYCNGATLNQGFEVKLGGELTISK